MKVRKIPIVVDAHRWFKNGDHPLDSLPPTDKIIGGERSEGKLVRYFRHPNIKGTKTCEYCGLPMYDHGWIDTFASGYVVCPGDWIITSAEGEHCPCKPTVFEKSYEKVQED